jgi:hypothetical protein
MSIGTGPKRINKAFRSVRKGAGLGPDVVLTAFRRTGCFAAEFLKEPVMSHFDAYRDSFPNARLTRSKTGVLEVALHTNGGALAFNGYTTNSSSISFTPSVPTAIIALSS